MHPYKNYVLLCKTQMANIHSPFVVCRYYMYSFILIISILIMDAVKTGRDSWRLLRGIVEQKERALNGSSSRSGIGVVDLDCLLRQDRIVEKRHTTVHASPRYHKAVDCLELRKLSPQYIIASQDLLQIIRSLDEHGTFAETATTKFRDQST